MESPPSFAQSPPERVDLDGGYALVRVDGSLVEAAVTGINESLDHLAPWMAWAAEPATVEGITALFADATAAWDARQEFVFSLLAPSEPGEDARVVGGFGLHGRIGPAGLEVGYWMHVDHAGRGLATAAAGALVRAAFAIPGIERVRIVCVADNRASARVPEKLGFEHLGTWSPPSDDGDKPPHQFWETTADAWSARDVPAQR